MFTLCTGKVHRKHGKIKLPAERIHFFQFSLSFIVRAFFRLRALVELLFFIATAELLASHLELNF